MRRIRMLTVTVIVVTMSAMAGLRGRRWQAPWRAPGWRGRGVPAAVTVGQLIITISEPPVVPCHK